MKNINGTTKLNTNPVKALKNPKMVRMDSKTIASPIDNTMKIIEIRIENL